MYGVEQTLRDKKYQTVPEEFYTKTNRLVVTPENLNDWFSAHEDLRITWVFQENFSGSGRSSTFAYFAKLPVLFPVDLRYGWDLTLRAHRDMVTKVQKQFRVSVKFSAPDCRH